MLIQWGPPLKWNALCTLTSLPRDDFRSSQPRFYYCGFICISSSASIIRISIICLQKYCARGCLLGFGLPVLTHTDDFHEADKRVNKSYVTDLNHVIFCTGGKYLDAIVMRETQEPIENRLESSHPNLIIDLLKTSCKC